LKIYICKLPNIISCQFVHGDRKWKFNSDWQRTVKLYTILLRCKLWIERILNVIFSRVIMSDWNRNPAHEIYLWMTWVMHYLENSVWQYKNHVTWSLPEHFFVSIPKDFFWWRALTSRRIPLGSPHSLSVIFHLCVLSVYVLNNWFVSWGKYALHTFMKLKKKFSFVFYDIRNI
jgi:hypothetical protein